MSYKIVYLNDYSYRFRVLTVSDRTVRIRDEYVERKILIWTLYQDLRERTEPRPFEVGSRAEAIFLMRDYPIIRSAGGECVYLMSDRSFNKFKAFAKAKAKKPQYLQLREHFVPGEHRYSRYGKHMLLEVCRAEWFDHFIPYTGESRL